MNEGEYMTNKNQKNIILMYIITFLQGLVVYSTIATLYRQSRGLSLADFALIESFSFVFTLLFEIPFGFIGDSIGYKKTLVIANGFYFLSKIVFWKAYGFNMFLLERLLLSLAIAGLSGIDMSILYLSSDKNQTQKVFGLYATFGTAGMLVSSGLFTLFFANNYDGCAVSTMIFYGLAFVLSLFIDETKQKDKTTEKITINNLKSIILSTLKDYKFLMILLSVSLITQASWTVSVMLNQGKYVSLGISEQKMGIIAIVISTAGLFSASIKFFTDRYGYKKIMTLICVILASCSLLMGYTKIGVIAILCNFLIDLSYSLFAPMINEIENKQITINDRATQLSVYAMVIDVYSILLNVVLSKVAEISIIAIFILCTIEHIVALIIILIFYKQKSISES